jgi:hypothetical protein
MSRTHPNAAERVLYRTGHIFVENPRSVARFLWRLARLQRHVFRELGASRKGAFAILWRVAQHSAGAFLRGVAPVLALGVLLWYVMRSLAASAGGLMHIVFDALLMDIILRDLLPVATAVIVAARSGASIAGRFASAPVTHARGEGRTDDFTFDDVFLYKETQRQLISTILTSALFYLMLVCCVLLGYVSSGVHAPQLDFAAVRAYAGDPARQALIINGILTVGLFGAIVAVVASALGIQAAEEFTSADEEVFELHTAIWESTAGSLALCILIAATRAMHIL